MKYIDADKLIAEIEKHQQNIDEISAKHGGKNSYRMGRQAEVDSIKSLIASLQQEQPEMNLEKYIENEINHYGLSLYEASYGTFSASQIDRIIRNAFELGLNARKE